MLDTNIWRITLYILKFLKQKYILLTTVLFLFLFHIFVYFVYSSLVLFFFLIFLIQNIFHTRIYSILDHIFSDELFLVVATSTS